MAIKLPIIISLVLLCWYVETQEATKSPFFHFLSARPPAQTTANPTTQTIAHQRTRPSSGRSYYRYPSRYWRTPPDFSPYGYGRYTRVKRCKNPNVEYRVYSGVNSSESTFWQVPEAPQDGSHVYLGTTGELRSIWVMEFVNASSDNPLYLLRTDGTPPFYITHHATGEISLQQQVTQESYFKFELGEFGGFSYRVPGTNKSIGVMNERLHIQTGRTPWYLQLPQLQCQSGGTGLLVAFKHQITQQMMWYHDLLFGSSDVFVGMHTGRIPGNAKWIVSAMQQRFMGWTIRSYDNTDFYATWIAATDPLQLYTTQVASQDNRTFLAEYVSGTSKVKLLSPNSDKYIHIEGVVGQPDILGFGDNSQATSWVVRPLGWCCGSVCSEFSFDPICVYERRFDTRVPLLNF